MKMPDRDIISELQLCALKWISDNKLEKEPCDKCIYSTSRGECQYDDIAETIPTEQEPILDKIRAEIHANAEMHEDGEYYLRDEWIDEIIDKYKA